MKAELYIELNGRKTDHKMLLDMAKEIWKTEGNRVRDLLSLELFFKPDENRCYYIFNHENKGYFEV